MLVSFILHPSHCLVVVISIFSGQLTGDGRGHNGCSSKKSILVEVGGIRSSVGSQFVSNQDFLEVRLCKLYVTIMHASSKGHPALRYCSIAHSGLNFLHLCLQDEIKAWWCTTVNSGRKIPSLDELNSKLNHRKILGF